MINSNEPQDERVIELSELRIGNYLYYQDELAHVTMLSRDIDDEYEDTIGFCRHWETTNEIASWNRSLVGNLKRIPLTTEWLEKFGFQWDENRYDGETLIVRRGCLELHHDEDQPKTGYSIAIFDDGNITYAGYEIRFIHQLQNLFFALTGEELTIKESV